jgi:hypothetical protein
MSLDIQIYPSKQSKIEQILTRLSEKEPEKKTIEANTTAKKILEANPFRHQLILMNFSGLDILYGSNKDKIIIPLKNNSIHTYGTHLFTLYINEMPFNIHHADWPWGLFITNPNAQNVDIILIEVS